MATVNKRVTRATVAATVPGTPLQTVAQDTVTFEGAPAYSRTAKSDLFLLSVSNFYGEDTFYEGADDRNERFKGLVRQVAAEDPAWLMAFLPWLRKEANIRTAAIVAAVEAAKVFTKLPEVPGGEVGLARKVLGDTFGRADEPAEALAYWLSTYGRKVPAAILRGIRDGAVQFYNERNYIKWDGGDKAVRMADVVELTHPAPKMPWQSILFKYMVDSRHRPTDVPVELAMLTKRGTLLAMSDEERAQFLNSATVSEQLQAAGMTWEQVASWGKFTAKKWEALIPTMGYMALLRNLRNFQEAGISAKATQFVAAKLADADEVTKSRQLPYRFLSAYLEATGTQWAHPLELALSLSTQNIPELPGRTLVLVDTSGSMTTLGLSGKSKIVPMMAGALFGVALAAKNGGADLRGFADGVFTHQVKVGSSVLRETERFVRRSGEVGHGTQTAAALKSSFKGHDRVVIVTDEQTFGPDRGWYQGNVGDQIPADVPLYAFNIGGYKPAMMETSATRHQLGGLTDRTFAMIKLVEAGQRSAWPWEQQ